MIDPQLLRKDVSLVAQKLATRRFHLDVDAYTQLEASRKTLQASAEDLQAKRNQFAKQIGMKKAKGEDASMEMSQSLECNDALLLATTQLDHLQKEISDFLMNIPNLPHESVPIGADETGNVEMLKWGNPPQFDFPIRDHVDLGAMHGLDFESAAKITGSRFVVLKGALAKLHRALAQYMLDLHTEQHGYQEINVPFMVNAASMRGTGQLPKFEEDLFKVPRKLSDSGSDQEGAVTENFYLIPTAEVPVTNLARDVIMNAQELPIKYVSHTPCFRSEAGAYGRDVRGMIRQHQFEKVELVQFVKPDQSLEALEQLTLNAQAVLEGLGIAYRKVLLCTGDMGFGSAKTYDLEAWIPSQNTYREISSCSTMWDFQARRMQARMKEGQNKPELIHTLNGSGLAIGRCLVALIENNQQADGGIYIPEPLRKYMGGLEHLKPNTR